MSETPLLVDPARIGRKLGLRTLTGDQREDIEDAIAEAMDAVVAHIRRPLVPTDKTVSGLYPVPGRALDAWNAWNPAIDDDYTVTSYVLEPSGTYTVTFRVGLDATQHPAIARYVRAHATEALRNDPVNGMGERAITSESAEGQSVSYESAKISAGDAGALPQLSTLNQFIRRSAYQANRPATPPWPMSGTPVGWDPR